MAKNMDGKHLRMHVVCYMIKHAPHAKIKMNRDLKGIKRKK